MTKPDEVTVSDDTLDWFDSEWPREPGKLEQKRRLLQALIAARVPDAEKAQDRLLGNESAAELIARKIGHNTLRDAVLKGLRK